jgi:hypothetical protein
MNPSRATLRILAAITLSVALVTTTTYTAAQSAPAGSDIVNVAPPTGEREADRASILGALERVRPGGTVQFAPRTYMMGGEIIRITIPDLTLLGHTEGTTLRGCQPEEMVRELGARVLGERCNLLEPAGPRQAVRNLTFEHAFWALHVGCCWEVFPFMEGGEGGQLIEGNTFRSKGSHLEAVRRDNLVPSFLHVLR